ncbi:hypothetical protein [Streptomyces drozdowiczii]|uniref:hypothetical protein n=1 Tax=Streptomyces drozdowiczii TaxID=202862 RepID=UPI00403CCDFC
MNADEDDMGFWDLIGQAESTPPTGTETRKALLDKAEAVLDRAEQEAETETKKSE